MYQKLSFSDFILFYNSKNRHLEFLNLSPQGLISSTFYCCTIVWSLACRSLSAPSFSILWLESPLKQYFFLYRNVDTRGRNWHSPFSTVEKTETGRKKITRTKILLGTTDATSLNYLSDFFGERTIYTMGPFYFWIRNWIFDRSASEP